MDIFEGEARQSKITDIIYKDVSNIKIVAKVLIEFLSDGLRRRPLTYTYTII